MQPLSLALTATQRQHLSVLVYIQTLVHVHRISLTEDGCWYRQMSHAALAIREGQVSQWFLQ